MCFPDHTCETADPPGTACAGCDAVRTAIAEAEIDMGRRLGVGFRYGPEVHGVPVRVITDDDWWRTRWNSAAAARATYAELMGVSVDDIHAEGPDGGPYVISFAPSH